MRLVRIILDRVKRHGWLTLLAFAVLIVIFPVAHKTTRLLLLVCVAALWLWGVFLLRRRQAFAATVLIAGILLLGWLCLPGSPADPDAIQRSYVQCLKQYRGTVYVWGGENRMGIDCSGLVRRGLINANAKVGVRTLNPRLVRSALSLWWHDCSARALRDGFRGLTIRLATTPSINSTALDTISPGDLAVTAGGIHVLAYLGGNTWIEADPKVMRVITVDVPSDNIWFTTPVQLVRWSQMNKAPNKNVDHQGSTPARLPMLADGRTLTGDDYGP